MYMQIGMRTLPPPSATVVEQLLGLTPSTNHIRIIKCIQMCHHWWWFQSWHAEHTGWHILSFEAKQCYNAMGCQQSAAT